MGRKTEAEGGRREVKQSRTISELKAENKILKRRISRLEKRLTRFTDEDFDEDSPDEESPAPIPKKQAGPKCPECDGEDFIQFDTPNRVMVMCRRCKTRLS